MNGFGGGGLFSAIFRWRFLLRLGLWALIFAPLVALQAYSDSTEDLTNPWQLFWSGSPTQSQALIAPIAEQFTYRQILRNLRQGPEYARVSLPAGLMQSAPLTTEQYSVIACMCRPTMTPSDHTRLISIFTATPTASMGQILSTNGPGK